MPKLYFIVRFDSNKNTKPEFNTTDVSITGVPAALSTDHSREYHTYIVIDNETPDGPWVYRVAIDIAKATGAQVRIQHGTLSEEDAFNRLKKIPDHVRASDAERKRNNPDHSIKAQVIWQGDICLQVKLRNLRFCWYELVVVEVEDFGKGVYGMSDADRGGDMKRRRVEVEQAVEEDEDIFDDEEDMDDM